MSFTRFCTSLMIILMDLQCKHIIKTITFHIYKRKVRWLFGSDVVQSSSRRPGSAATGVSDSWSSSWSLWKQRRSNHGKDHLYWGREVPPEEVSHCRDLSYINCTYHSIWHVLITFVMVVVSYALGQRSTCGHRVT